jgi:hypothetical protein
MCSTDTYRINTPGVIGQDRFEANVTLPMGAVIIDIPEALTSTETKCAQLNVSGLSPVAPIVLAVEVERVQMLAAPVQDDLEDGVELRQGGVAADEESAPDERTDLSEGDTQLIDTGRFRWLAHRWSVTQYAVSLKASPRNLALSTKGISKVGSDDHDAWGFTPTSVVHILCVATTSGKTDAVIVVATNSNEGAQLRDTVSKSLIKRSNDFTIID